MIEIQGLDGIPAFLQSLSLEMARLDREISSEFEKWTKTIYSDIVMGTPQYTGNLVAAWTYSIQYIDESYSPTANKIEHDQIWSKADVYARGEQPGVGTALFKAAGVHPSWRDEVWIHNPAPYADLIENQRIILRPVNLVDGRVAMVQYAVDKYNSGGYGL